MTDHREIVARLRKVWCEYEDDARTCDEAAALIETQAAEVTRAKADRDAEIMAWLRGGAFYNRPSPANVALFERLAAAIASGSIEEKGSE